MTSTRHAITGIDAVANAARAIPAEIYLGPHGDAVEPVVSPRTTWRELRELRLEPRMRVLQIGTGSGYAAALMAHIVGPDGHVLTIGPDSAVSVRARGLFVAHGHRAVAVTGTGLAGHPGRAPYDRIVVAGTPATIPGAWIDQLARGGILATGCTVSDLPDSFGIAHITRAPDDDLHVTVHPGQNPLLEPSLRLPHITVATAPDDPRNWLAWASDDQQTATELLTLLRAATPQPWPDLPGEFLDFKNWLLARRPRGLLVASTRHGNGIGIGARVPNRPSSTAPAQPGGPLEVMVITPTHLVAAPAPSPTWARFLDLVDDWRSEGSRTTAELDAVVLRDGDSYRVRLDD